MSAHDSAADVAKALPPLTITGMTVLGFPISDWVLLLTAIYTLLQIYLLVKRMVTPPKLNRRYDDPPDTKASYEHD